MCQRRYTVVMFELYGIFVFILGMIIGSFLNVVIYRFNTGRGFGGRSFCFTCRRTLSWHELVPIVSFINQRGRCHGCASRISYQYPIVEAITGLVFVSLFIKIFPFMNGTFVTNFPHLFYLIFTTYLFCVLIVISVYDYHHQVIPDKLVWIFNSLAFIGVFLFIGSTYMIHVPTLGAILAGPIIAVPFLLLWILTSGRGMGFGDVKLALGMGWLLGLQSGLAAVLVSFWIGGLFGLFILLARKNTYTLKSRIAFGPFMCIATFFVYLFSVTIMDILTISF